MRGIYNDGDHLLKGDVSGAPDCSSWVGIGWIRESGPPSDLSPLQARRSLGEPITT